MRIATWNVNSINARLEAVTSWLAQAAPDVALLQELKCVNEKFPREAIEALGYNVEVFGQKSYNGVAILSKFPLSDLRRGLEGEADDDQARYIEAVVEAKTPIRVASIYLPNGNPIGTEKFDYKIRFLERLRVHARNLLDYEEILVLGGDYNVIPRDQDCHDPATWVNDALTQPQSRAGWQALKNLGLACAYDLSSLPDHAYTFWDYQAGAWPRNHGIRIDHHLLSPQAADRFLGLCIEKQVRDGEKPSDHVPVVLELDLSTR